MMKNKQVNLLKKDEAVQGDQTEKGLSDQISTPVSPMIGNQIFSASYHAKQLIIDSLTPEQVIAAEMLSGLSKKNQQIKELEKDQISKTQKLLTKKSVNEPPTRELVERVKNRLFSREAASLFDENGVPFFIIQMGRDRKIMANKVLNLRINSNSQNSSMISKHIKPKSGSYILDRINANEKVFEKYRDKYNLRHTQLSTLNSQRKKIDILSEEKNLNNTITLNQYYQNLPSYFQFQSQNQTHQEKIESGQTDVDMIGIKNNYQKKKTDISAEIEKAILINNLKLTTRKQIEKTHLKKQLNLSEKLNEQKKSVQYEEVSVQNQQNQIYEASIDNVDALQTFRIDGQQRSSLNVLHHQEMNESIIQQQNQNLLTHEEKLIETRHSQHLRTSSKTYRNTAKNIDSNKKKAIASEFSSNKDIQNVINLKDDQYPQKNILLEDSVVLQQKPQPKQKHSLKITERMKNKLIEQNGFDNSVSGKSKVSIAETQLKELGIYNYKLDSTQNMFGPFLNPETETPKRLQFLIPSLDDSLQITKKLIKHAPISMRYKPIKSKIQILSDQIDMLNHFQELNGVFLFPQNLSPKSLANNQKILAQLQNVLRKSGQHPLLFNVKENDLLNIDEIKKFNRSPRYNIGNNEQQNDQLSDLKAEKNSNTQKHKIQDFFERQNNQNPLFSPKQIGENKKIFSPISTSRLGTADCYLNKGTALSLINSLYEYQHNNDSFEKQFDTFFNKNAESIKQDQHQSLPVNNDLKLDQFALFSLQEDKRPLWLVNKKPKSKIINYKTSKGQDIIKVSVGDQNPLNFSKRDNSVKKNQNEQQIGNNTLQTNQSLQQATNEIKIVNNQSQEQTIIKSNSGKNDVIIDLNIKNEITTQKMNSEINEDDEKKGEKSSNRPQSSNLRNIELQYQKQMRINARSALESSQSRLKAREQQMSEVVGIDDLNQSHIGADAASLHMKPKNNLESFKNQNISNQYQKDYLFPLSLTINENKDKYVNKNFNKLREIFFDDQNQNLSPKRYIAGLQQLKVGIDPRIISQNKRNIKNSSITYIQDGKINFNNFENLNITLRDQKQTNKDLECAQMLNNQFQPTRNILSPKIDKSFNMRNDLKDLSVITTERRSLNYQLVVNPNGEMSTEGNKKIYIKTAQFNNDKYQESNNHSNDDDTMDQMLNEFKNTQQKLFQQLNMQNQRYQISIQNQNESKRNDFRNNFKNDKNQNTQNDTTLKNSPDFDKKHIATENNQLNNSLSKTQSYNKTLMQQSNTNSKIVFQKKKSQQKDVSNDLESHQKSSNKKQRSKKSSLHENHIKKKKQSFQAQHDILDNMKIMNVMSADKIKQKSRHKVELIGTSYQISEQRGDDSAYVLEPEENMVIDIKQQSNSIDKKNESPKTKNSVQFKNSTIKEKKNSQPSHKVDDILINEQNLIAIKKQNEIQAPLDQIKNRNIINNSYSDSTSPDNNYLVYVQGVQNSKDFNQILESQALKNIQKNVKYQGLQINQIHPLQKQEIISQNLMQNSQVQTVDDTDRQASDNVFYQKLFQSNLGKKQNLKKYMKIQGREFDGGYSKIHILDSSFENKTSQNSLLVGQNIDPISPSIMNSEISAQNQTKDDIKIILESKDRNLIQDIKNKQIELIDFQSFQNLENIRKKSVLENEANLNRRLKEQPPKYYGKENFGLKFQFQKPTIQNNQFSLQLASRGTGAQFQDQNKQDISINTVNLKYQMNVNNLNIKELCNQSRSKNKNKILFKAVANKNDSIIFNDQNQKKIHSLIAKTDQQAKTLSPQQINSHNYQNRINQSNTMFKYSQAFKNEGVGNLLISANKTEMQNKQRVRANIAQIRSESPESRFSSDYGKNIDRNFFNPWDATRALSRASEENRFFTFANNYKNSNKGQIEENKNEDNSAILDELTAEYNRISHQDSQEYKNLKNLIDNYNEQEKLKKLQKLSQPKEIKKGNLFQGVHKGLVSSLNPQKNINKLSNLRGSFDNKDDIQVHIKSPRDAFRYQGSPQQTSQFSKSTKNQFESQKSRQQKIFTFNSSLKSIALQSQLNNNQIQEMQNQIFKLSQLKNYSINEQKYQQDGARKLFTLPTTVVEDLRKDFVQEQKKQEINFGLISQRCQIAENILQQRKGGGLLVIHKQDVKKKSHILVDGKQNQSTIVSPNEGMNKSHLNVVMKKI